MKERPILFSAPMVRAILEGRKTQTRRAIKPQPTGELRPLSEWSRGLANACHDYSPDLIKLEEHSQRLKGRIFPFTTTSGSLISPSCPYGQPGDRLWIRESWAFYDDIVHYRADNQIKGPWRPSIHMPRWASRINLEITGMRVERLQDITDEDAIKEGALLSNPSVDSSWSEGFGRACFKTLWDSLNASRGFGWAENPWVWVVEFKRIEP